MSDVESYLAGGSLISRSFYSLIRNLLVLLCLVVTRVRIIDRHKVPATGAFILAPIHRSNIDSPLASAVTRRRMRFMGKDSLWKVRPVGWVLSALGGFPVSRGTADREALKRCIAVLESGVVSRPQYAPNASAPPAARASKFGVFRSRDPWQPRSP